jgi:hypothetical protein
VRTRRGDADEEIEDREADVPEMVLDVVTEDPQEQHVAGQVQDRSVQEHGREDGKPDVLVGEDLL